MILPPQSPPVDPKRRTEYIPNKNLWIVLLINLIQKRKEEIK